MLTNMKVLEEFLPMKWFLSQQRVIATEANRVGGGVAAVLYLYTFIYGSTWLTTWYSPLSNMMGTNSLTCIVGCIPLKFSRWPVVQKVLH